MFSNGLHTEVFVARAWFLGLLEVNVLRSEHLNYHKKTLRTLDIRGISKKIKALRTFHSWGRRLIPESLAPEDEVQAVYEENVNIATYIR